MHSTSRTRNRRLGVSHYVSLHDFEDSMSLAFAVVLGLDSEDFDTVGEALRERFGLEGECRRCGGDGYDEVDTDRGPKLTGCWGCSSTGTAGPRLTVELFTAIKMRVQGGPDADFDMKTEFIKLPHEFVGEDGFCKAYNVYNACPFSKPGAMDGSIPVGVQLCELPLPPHCKIHNGLDR